MMNLSNLSQSINKNYTNCNPLGVIVLEKKLELFKNELRAELKTPFNPEVNKSEKVQHLSNLVMKGGLLSGILRRVGMTSSSILAQEKALTGTDKVYLLNSRLPTIKTHFDFIDFI